MRLERLSATAIAVALAAMTCARVTSGAGYIVKSFPAPAGTQPNGLAWDGHHLWMSSYILNGGIYKLDPQDGSVLGIFTPPVAPSVTQPGTYPPALPVRPGPDVVITTQPTLQGKKKSAVPIEARVEGEVGEVLLQYRLKGGVSYIKVPMVKGEDEVWRAEIPGWACTTLGVEYFIQAKKGPFRYTTEATQESPYLIQIK